MQLETEIKYPVVSFTTVLESIASLKMPCTSWYFEENLVLDTDDGNLRRRGVLLRIRKGQGGKVTMKLPVAGREESGCKQRHEIESGIEDPDQMLIMLTHLGFKTWFRYEKFRRVCRRGKTRICLDILPFGSFIELEGQQESFHDIARELGLDPEKGTALNYHDLHQEYRRGHGLEPDPNFVFHEPQKRDLALKLNVII
ncbi:class IV adenylate cyclase [Desulfonatronospira sp.]|uniref:class IV adenylate cyclase n=1 Tax=Desulfonatronospira sp. TaxID=1962951 RepID=UPI0025BB5EAA|nr:class IV adenylate cyclase [Desulfonatronospira sp.]